MLLLQQGISNIHVNNTLECTPTSDLIPPGIYRYLTVDSDNSHYITCTVHNECITLGHALLTTPSRLSQQG